MKYFDKSGNSVFGPADNSTIWQGFTGGNTNDGDPIVLYDELADRWLATQFSVAGTPDYILLAVSQTNDPTGSWYRYAFQFNQMPDYPKFGIWEDGYYMGLNSSGDDVVVLKETPCLREMQMLKWLLSITPTNQTADFIVLCPLTQMDNGLQPVNRDYF